MWLLLLLRSCLAASAPPGGDVVPAAAASAGGPAARQRIAYVTNTWWPKVDGAAITVMGHARYFSEHGHDVLVVRPSYPDDSPVWERAVEAGMASDPVPPSPTLQFLSYRMVGNRGGGFEPEMDASDLSRVEKGLTAWEPNIVLVVDPDYFVLDTFRVPGLNTLMQLPSPPTMIACMTTFCIEAIRKMPEYWLAPPPLAACPQGLATSYGQFDHIFVNGDQSAAYLRPMTVLRGSSWEPLPPARVVKSRGVPADFCTALPEADCAAERAVSLMRERPRGHVAFLYVGRLSFDKSVDELVAAFEAARRSGRAKRATLYLAGSGELEPLVHAAADRLGPASVSHRRISCVLREADAYVSAAHNETYGRSLVEALRCGLPVVTMASCNMHVDHGKSGLLGEGTAELTEHISMVLDAQEATLRGPRIRRAWHPFWCLSLVLDHPGWTSLAITLASAAFMYAAWLCLSSGAAPAALPPPPSPQPTNKTD
ncbi:hypothetical protein EMIHUDRAFT_103357 [Emiliania huxleyi CCMP1516]|uniref:Glycosyl transferase family 1 domain-containing protein n=2 Tax=Emiliania huxleyi TaxID=2903 RepID=A0A0D3IVW1_EMIH1|nr:hypothetical protein EMIHUDRAFT_103357 [Emiliania huxleyi CCMP1516]EOD15396.1 hypothetical protein EMIHUDRAFT_103357 [Emiliania huxleyi CCMP1516]|eukprot:XP_005767825.1 hypothetical protein EMIHUDRAFT_103357 [Emiliania huxleyi CCMP1516]